MMDALYRRVLNTEEKFCNRVLQNRILKSSVTKISGR